MPAIRPIAIGLIWNNGSLLVEHGFDAVTGQQFFRPPGGAIEFGERAADALRREFMEEIEAELTDPQLLTVIENIFDYNGRPHHEVVFVFEARFTDSLLYDRTEFTIQDADPASVASWKSLAEMAGDERPLRPNGLTAVLTHRRRSTNRL